jgi:hypothetical protein
MDAHILRAFFIFFYFFLVRTWNLKDAQGRRHGRRVIDGSTPSRPIAQH